MPRKKFDIYYQTHYGEKFFFEKIEMIDISKRIDYFSTVPKLKEKLFFLVSTSPNKTSFICDNYKTLDDYIRLSTIVHNNKTILITESYSFYDLKNMILH